MMDRASRISVGVTILLGLTAIAFAASAQSLVALSPNGTAIARSACADFPRAGWLIRTRPDTDHEFNREECKAVEALAMMVDEIKRLKAKERMQHSKSGSTD